MINIIIPCYKAHDTVQNTLMSIAIQTEVKNVSVLIINDNPGGDDYSKIIKKFSEYIKIREIKMEKNQGPGAARQVGIYNSTEEYVMFVDADDVLCDCFALHHLMRAAENNPEANEIVTTFIEEVIDDQTKATAFVPHRNDNTWLFGKLYRRSFLLENNIKFTNTKANEDGGFNALFAMCNVGEKRTVCLDLITYIWRFNPNSITRSTDYLYLGMEGYVYNQKYAIKTAVENKVGKDIIANHTANIMCMLYTYFICLQDRPKEQLDNYMSWCADFYHNTYYNVKENISKEVFTSNYVVTQQGNQHLIAGKIPAMTILDFMDCLKNAERNGGDV